MHPANVQERDAIAGALKQTNGKIFGRKRRRAGALDMKSTTPGVVHLGPGS
jgi:hypothetical protein